MTLPKIARKYIEFLEKGEMQKVVELFSENGIVISPLYGEMPASEFYKELKRKIRFSQN